MESDNRNSALSSEFGEEGVHKVRRTTGPTRRSTKGQWTPEEDEILCKAVQKFKGKNWKKIAECFKDRSDVQCLHRWQKVLNPDLIKGPWSKEEDEIIVQLVNKYGPKKWSLIAQHLPGRIGKQCRERWHNHLNPAINKEAWTQEEELVLIRAHQTYGNRWAELTKFLPGRSDNAIKNHWNSSVKKKLDSYLASGLLSQLPPLSVPQNQPMPSKSSGKQSNGYVSGPTRAEAEEISECSQDSAIVACSQSGSEMKPTVLKAKEEMQWIEEHGSGKEQCFSLLSYIGQYCPLEDVDLSIPERTCEVGCSSKYLEQNISNNVESSVNRTCQFNMHHLPDISLLQLGLESSGFTMQCTDVNTNQENTENAFQNLLQLGPESSGFSMQCTDVNTNQENTENAFQNLLQLGLESSGFSMQCTDVNTNQENTENAFQNLLLLGLESSGFSMQCTDMNKNQEYTNDSFQNSAGMFSKSMEVIASSSDKLEHMLMSDDEFCRVLFSDEKSHGTNFYSSVLRDINVVDMGGCSDPLLCKSATIQYLESYSHLESEALGTFHQSCSYCQPAPSLLINDDNELRVSKYLHENHAEETHTIPHDVISNINNCANSSHDDGTDSTSMQVQQDVINDPSKLFPVISFSSQLDKVQTCGSAGADEKPDRTTEQQDEGVLCYEPPRFPSLDIPVFSCDLIQLGCEMQQDYSPLGIRKLMSSMDCMSPFKLWDSPSRDDSPKAVLKSAAKTFKRTPSILKKRARDIISPLPDRRVDRKMGTDLTKNVSCLDVMLVENGFSRRSRLPLASPFLRRTSEMSTEGKENLYHPDEVEKRRRIDGSESLISRRILEKDFENCGTLENGMQITLDSYGECKIGADIAVHPVQEPSEVLMEHDVNDIQLHTPVCSCANVAMSSGTPKSSGCQNSIVLSKASVNAQERILGNSSLLSGSSSRLCGNWKSVPVTSIHTISAVAPLEVDNLRKETCTEGLSIFGETPFKRGIESPSAWKSPWFFNSYFEDIDYNNSPGCRSYDALGLMKQISEHTAATYAEAQEALGNETPDRISKSRCFGYKNRSPQEEHLPSYSSNLTLEFKPECRILDFSDCESPVKEVEHEKSLSYLVYSSPSSYLLKKCR